MKDWVLWGGNGDPSREGFIIVRSSRNETGTLESSAFPVLEVCK